MTRNILQKLQDSQERSAWEQNSCSSHLLQSVLKSVVEGVLFISTEGVILTINPAAKQLLLNDKLQPYSKFWDVFPDEYFGFSMREALFLGVFHEKVYRTLSSKEVEITSTLLNNFPEKSQGLLLILHDITDKAEMRSKLQHGENLKKLGEMVASISHEIRNPLGGIRGYASLLSRDLTDQKHLQEMAGYIVDGTKSLERIVSRVLEYARPISLDLRSIEMGQYIRQFVKFVKQDPSKPLLVHMEVHTPEKAFLAPIDPEALKSALLNLIFNAYQAMQTGGVITLSVLKMDSCYQIAISDTGIGMSTEEVEKIFSPFFTTKENGNGLGLSEVQKIIKAHYGTIDVRSNPSKGTTFTLTLPLQRY